jgi:glycerate-2-kinase
MPVLRARKNTKAMSADEMLALGNSYQSFCSRQFPCDREATPHMVAAAQRYGLPHPETAARFCAELGDYIRQIREDDEMLREYYRRLIASHMQRCKTIMSLLGNPAMYANVLGIQAPVSAKKLPVLFQVTRALRDTFDAISNPDTPTGQLHAIASNAATMCTRTLSAVAEDVAPKAAQQFHELLRTTALGSGATQ